MGLRVLPIRPITKTSWHESMWLGVSGSERHINPIGLTGLVSGTSYVPEEYYQAIFNVNDYTYITCVYCRVKNREDGPFCIGCGAPL